MTTTSRAARLGLLAFLFAELTACGGGGGGSSPAPVPPPPPPAATVQSFSPADMSTQIDVQSTLSVSFDQALAPASVTRAHVRLVAQGVPVATKVTYDDAKHSVRIDPMGLDYGRTYTLTVSGLVDANGKTVADRHAVFTTWYNGEASGVSLTFTGWDTSTVYRAQVDTFDASGNPTGSDFSNDAGPDATWGTADDVLFGSYATDTYRNDGQLASEASFSAGTDGAWHTADDVSTPVKTRTFLPNGALSTETIISATDPDGGNLDSETYTTYSYDADGTRKTAVTATGKGADGVWGTADDVIGWGITYTYDDLGRLEKRQYASSPGADGLWGTADDVTYEHAQYFYLASGRLDRVEFYDRGSHSGTPGAPDNVLSSVGTCSYDAANNLVQYKYGAPGVDNGGYTLTTYDAHNNRLTLKLYDSAGADGILGTADDRLAGWRTYVTTR